MPSAAELVDVLLDLVVEVPRVVADAVGPRQSPGPGEVEAKGEPCRGASAARGKRDDVKLAVSAVSA